MATEESPIEDEYRLSIDSASQSRRTREARVVHYHKLDVLKSSQINRITILNVVVWTSSIVYVIVMLVLCNTVMFRIETVQWKDNPPIQIKHVPNSEFQVLVGAEMTLSALSCCLMMFLTIIYSARVLLNNKYRVTAVQWWVLVMLFTNALSMSPISSIWVLHDLAIGKDANKKWIKNPIFRKLIIAVWTTRSFGSTITIIFFLMAMSETYGMLVPFETRRERLFFYLPKLIPLVIYQVIRVMSRFKAKLILSLIPFGNISGMIANSISLQQWFLGPVIFVSLLTAFEVFFLVYIVYRISKTSQVLRNADYLQHRSKQIGFRTFLFNQVVYYGLLTVINLILTAGIPRYSELEYLFDPKYDSHFYARNSVGASLYEILNFFNQFITANIFLPPDAKGLKGWFCSSRNSEEEEFKSQPLSLSTIDPVSKATMASNDSRNNTQSLDLRIHFSTLYLPTHAGLLNMAWMAYDWGRSGIEDAKLWLKQTSVRFHEHIHDASSDTNLIILSDSERIIIAFKGTTSFDNIRTDLNAVRVPISGLLPTLTSTMTNITNSRDWKRTLVHKGFLDSYLTVNKRITALVVDLMKDKPRSIMLTGHSLGGALATVCSLDLRLSLGLSETELLVSTFGSPKCGNGAWAVLYDRVVPAHWRFTVTKDVVTLLPKMGYKHVGKRVLLMEKGNIFLDPNSLEGVMWIGEIPSIDFHRKDAYLRCITLFAANFTEYVPNFWGHNFHNEDSVVQVLESKKQKGLKPKL